MSVTKKIFHACSKKFQRKGEERRGEKEGEHSAREGASFGRRIYQDESSSALDMSHNQNNNAFRGGFAQILGSGPSMENADAYQAIQAKPDTPTRRRAALQTLKPGQGNVSMLQRIKNFVVPPRDLAAIKKAGNDDIIMASPAKAMASPQKKMQLCASSVDHHSAAAEVLHSDDLMAGVMRFVDMGSAMNCRAVCKQWKALVAEAGMDPLEAGCKGEELDKGVQSQQLLETNLKQARKIYTPEHAAFLGTHLSRQEGVSKEMRETLVNWVIEVHFKFKFREPCLHLALQLVDRYMSQVLTGRRKYQTVGVTGFLLGCKFEERHKPNVGDLSYITDYSSTRGDIVDMEKAMLEKLTFELVQPKPSDFVARYAKAAGIVALESERAIHTWEHAIILFFIDIAAINYNFCGIKPSDITAAAVACALKCLGRPMWSKRLAFYTGIEDITHLSTQMLEFAKRCEATCLKLKYSSSRFGGESAPDGTRGCYTFVRRFLETVEVPRVLNTIPDDGLYV